MSHLQPNCCLKIDFKGGPTCRRQVVNPRHQTPQGQSVANPETPLPSWLARCDIKGFSYVDYFISYMINCPLVYELKRWGREKLTAILQTVFENYNFLECKLFCIDPNLTDFFSQKTQMNNKTVLVQLITLRRICKGPRACLFYQMCTILLMCATQPRRDNVHQTIPLLWYQCFMF